MPFNDGLPNVIVKELEIHYDNGTISAATFGRGVWESPLNTLSTNINDVQQLSFSIYPNPAKNQITISSNSQNITTKILTLTGQKIITSTSTVINTSILKSGCYIVEVNSNNIIARKKLIIR